MANGNGFDFTRFAGARPVSTGALAGLLSGLSARGQQQLSQQQTERDIEKQQRERTLQAIRLGIDPGRFDDPEHLREVAQRRATQQPLGSSEFERLVAMRQSPEFASLPQEQRDLVTSRLNVISRDPMALLRQTQAQATGRLQAQQQFRPETERRVALARGQAERELALPKAESQAESMLATIDDILKDKEGIQASTGGLGGLVGRQAQAFPLSEAQRRFIPKLEQLQGQSFLQAFESLKGGGQITEIEGRKAEQAIARLNTSQSPDDFVKAINDLKNVVMNARARASRGIVTNGLSETQPQDATIQQSITQPTTQTFDVNDPLGIR